MDRCMVRSQVIECMEDARQKPRLTPLMMAKILNMVLKIVYTMLILNRLLLGSPKRCMVEAHQMVNASLNGPEEHCRGF